ncbi:MAG TPA: DNA methyltransferase, partial [Vicinamibacterales bacterium]|nr:DNA methyltransferase [Vicinamibacterales bacterium]
RRTLAPLVQNAKPDSILSLRVLDPAMGSGAFLVAACRYLAGAYEIAVVRESGLSPSDISEADRAGFRRCVAQRCLYGVDINPMAVQLARLSLWLATLAADRPLTFLDHHLRTGNSLVGATFADVARQPPPGRRASRVQSAAMPLFAEMSDADIGIAIGIRQAIATEPGDTLDQVRAKERALASLHDAGSMLEKWTRVFDLWCSGWFQAGEERVALRTAFSSLVDEILTGRSGLNAGLAARLLGRSHAVAADQRFFHWELEFPEVFSATDGSPLSARGFDAVIGNPPWDTLRGDLGDQARRDQARRAASSLSDFARGSGTYALQSEGHANLYQLFLERVLSLVHANGRLGLVLPSGFAVDHGSAALRRAVLDRAHIDTLIGIENRDGVFPIHRGLKFLMVTATTGRRTTVLPCRFGVRRTEVFEQLPDVGPDPAAVPIPTPLVERISGPGLAIPELRTRDDLDVATQIALKIPALEDISGWHVHFGRELNVTEDRRHFTADRGLPVIEGKHVRPFEVAAASARFRITPERANRLPPARGAMARARLAYRDVASASNRLTLIAAIVPARVLTTHTLFCLKDDLDADSQHVLCGLFNSFVANYLVRLRVGTHVTTAIIGRLPVPRPARDAPEFSEMCALSRTLHREPSDRKTFARLHVLAATMYGISHDQLRHIVDTFPLIPAAERAAVMSGFAI